MGDTMVAATVMAMVMTTVVVDDTMVVYAVTAMVTAAVVDDTMVVAMVTAVVTAATTTDMVAEVSSHIHSMSPMTPMTMDIKRGTIQFMCTYVCTYRFIQSVITYSTTQRSSPSQNNCITKQ